MTHTQKFIEDAIKGGYRSNSTFPHRVMAVHIKNQHRILLDPLAWQAVGKTRGWNKQNHCPICGDKETYGDWEQEWRYNMHRFTDHIADGLSIEESLGTL